MTIKLTQKDADTLKSGEIIIGNTEIRGLITKGKEYKILSKSIRNSPDVYGNSNYQTIQIKLDNGYVAPLRYDLEYFSKKINSKEFLN